MLKMEEFLLIRDLYNQGLNISEIARETGFDRKTIWKYIAAQILLKPKKLETRLNKLDPLKEYIQQRINEYSLSALRIYREIRDQGFTWKYTIVKDYFRKIWPRETLLAVLRYETKPGVQAQVDWGDRDHIDEDKQ